MIKEDTWLSLSDSTCTHIAHTENTLKTLKKQNQVIYMTSVYTYTYICREKVIHTYMQRENDICIRAHICEEKEPIDMIPVVPSFGSRGRRISAQGHPLQHSKFKAC